MTTTTNLTGDDYRMVDRIGEAAERTQESPLIQDVLDQGGPDVFDHLIAARLIMPVGTDSVDLTAAGWAVWDDMRRAARMDLAD